MALMANLRRVHEFIGSMRSWCMTVWGDWAIQCGAAHRLGSAHRLLLGFWGWFRNTRLLTNLPNLAIVLSQVVLVYARCLWVCR